MLNESSASLSFMVHNSGITTQCIICQAPTLMDIGQICISAYSPSLFPMAHANISLKVLLQRVQSGLCGNTLATLEKPQDESIISAVSITLILQPL